MASVVEYRSVQEKLGDVPHSGASVGGGDFLRILWRRKVLVLFGLLAGVVAGLMLYFQKQPMYQSSGQIMVQNRRSTDTEIAQSRSSFVTDWMAGQEALVKSYDIQSRAAKLLKEDNQFVEKPGNNNLEDYINYIASGLQVSRYRDSSSGSVSNVLVITFRSPNPRDSQNVINKIHEGYSEAINFGISAITEDTYKELKRSQESLEKRKRETDTQLAKIQLDIYTTSPYSFESLSAKIQEDERSMQKLGDQVSDYDYQLDLIKKSPTQPEARSSLLMLLQRNDPYLRDQRFELQKAQSLEESLYALELALGEKTQSMGPSHPEVKAIEKRMSTLREIMKKRDSNIDGNYFRDPMKYYEMFVENELKKARTKLKIIDDKNREDRELHRKLSELVVKDRSLKQSQEMESVQIKNLEYRLAQIEVNKENPTTRAVLIQPPSLGTKVSPVLVQYLAIAGLLGLIAGSGLAYLAELTDRSFRSPDEIRRRLGVQIIGHIPILRRIEEDLPNMGQIDNKLITVLKPKSVESEAYRGVRTSLYFNTRERGHQVIQVTSPNSGDGKSTLSANLAISVAQSGRKVILIDCDFRKPRVHKIFGLDKKNKSDVGIVSVIKNEAELFSAIQECEEIPGLFLLPCGPRPENPAELLTSPKFQEILQRIRDEYELVIIDTPPLLAVSDPSVVAPRVDGVILTITISKNGRPSAERAREMLASVGANVLGIVVNNSNRMGSGYGGYGYGYSYNQYNYRYGYGTYGGYGYSYEEPYGEEPEQLEDGKERRRLRPKG